MTRLVIVLRCGVACQRPTFWLREHRHSSSAPSSRAAGRLSVLSLKESIVIDFAQASAAVKSPASTITPPTDMKDLIARYDSGIRARINEILDFS